MSYNDWAPLMASCLPLCLPDVMHMTLSPRPPFLHTASHQKLEVGMAWDEANAHFFLVI